MNPYAIIAWLIGIVFWSAIGVGIAHHIPTCKPGDPSITVGNMLVAGCKEPRR